MVEGADRIDHKVDNTSTDTFSDDLRPAVIEAE